MAYGEPGAKLLVDDLLLGRGLVGSRAAPSLQPIESQPSTQGFVRKKKKLKQTKKPITFTF